MEALELSSFSRREFLTACLGAGAALTACRARAPELAFEGQLLGQSAARGHKLRDGFRPPPARREKLGVAIIGAGQAGLSAAWKLERSGFGDFAVLELEDHAGGTSAYGQNDVSAYPWGAHYVPVPLPGSTDLSTLMQELGVVDHIDQTGHLIAKEQFLCRAPQERLFIGGEWQEGLFPRVGATREDLAQFQAFMREMDRYVEMRDSQGRRAFTIPSVYSGETPDLDALDKISMAEWLAQKGWTSPRLRWFVEYACRDDYGCLLDTTSAWAGIFYFTSRVEKAGGKAAEFVTFPEGNGRLVKHLADVAGARLRTGFAVTDVIPREDGVEVHAWDVSHNEIIAFDAEHAIFALPQFLAGHLVAPCREKRPAHLDAFSWSPWVVANITLRSRPDEDSFPLAWDNVLYDSKSLGYVVATHQTGKDYGSTVWTWYLPLTDRDPKAARQLLLSADWKHWADVIVADLRRAHPHIVERISHLDVWRWGHAMIRPLPGLMRGGALAAARSSIGRLHFANTDLSGMALFEEAQHWGVEAAKAVLAERAK